jgi:mRNA interferase RelE/StbE
VAEYSVELKPSARKELERLPVGVIGRVFPRLEGLGSEPRPSGCKELKGGRDEWRIRVGEYRVVYTMASERGLRVDWGRADGVGGKLGFDFGLEFEADHGGFRVAEGFGRRWGGDRTLRRTSQIRVLGFGNRYCVPRFPDSPTGFPPSSGAFVIIELQSV